MLKQITKVLISMGVLTAFASLICAIKTNASSLPISSMRVEPIHIESFGNIGTLREIARQTNITIGLEARMKRESTVVLDFPGGTITDLLNMFVAQVPGYGWQESNGSIRVIGDQTASSLANLMISYPGATDKTRQKIWQDIAKRPEVSAWLMSHHCSREEFLYGKEFKDHDRPISIKSGNMTLAHVLDEAASKSGENFWAIVNSSSDDSCRIGILLW